MEFEDFSYMLEKEGDGKRIVPLASPLSYMSYDYNAGIKGHWDKNAKKFAELAQLCNRLDLPVMVCQTAGMYLHRFLEGYYGKVKNNFSKYIVPASVYIATYLHKYPIPMDELFDSKKDAKKGKNVLLKIIYRMFLPVEKIHFVKSKEDEAIAIINREAQKFGLDELDILQATRIIKKMDLQASITPRSIAIIAIFSTLLTKMKYYGISRIAVEMKANRMNDCIYIEAVGE